MLLFVKLFEVEDSDEKELDMVEPSQTESNLEVVLGMKVVVDVLDNRLDGLDDELESTVSEKEIDGLVETEMKDGLEVEFEAAELELITADELLEVGTQEDNAKAEE